MRKLMWFSIGFGAACAFCAYLQWEHLWPLAIAGLLSAVLVWTIRGKWKNARRVAAILLGSALGIGWFMGFEALRLDPVRSLDGQIGHIRVEVSDYSYATDYGSAVEGKFIHEDKTYGIKLYLDEDKGLSPGDVITGHFKLRSTHGGSQEPTSHRAEGILVLGYQRGDIQTKRADTIPLKYYPAKLRLELNKIIDGIFPEDTAFFARALLLGDRSGIDYYVDTDLKVSGISHVISVSGLHVSILFAVIFLLCGHRRVLTALIGIPAVILFSAVAGFMPSITRACIMQCLMMLALLFDKEYDPPTSLAFAALVMMAARPLVITSIGFQLSVGCMAGIFLFSERIKTWIVGLPLWKDWKGKTPGVRLRQGFAGSVGITLSAMFFTTPLVAIYFGSISLVSVVTNLLTLWAVSLVFYSIMAACLLALVWQGAAAALAWCASWLIRYVLWICGALASLPLAAVYTTSIYIIFWLALCYVLILLFLTLKKRQPYVLWCCGILGLCLALMLSWAEPLMDDMRMTVLDVGQGQCVLLQADGRSFLIDCGGDHDDEAADLAAETVLAMGIARLDGVIVTHYDRDHAGGVAYLLSRIPADAVYLPDTADEEELLDPIRCQSGGMEVFVHKDRQIKWADNCLTIFAPVLWGSSNESGLTVLFTAGKYDILITGDLSELGEMLLIRQKQIPELTALVVGHHGSRSSTSEELLAATTPEYAFISVGEDNRYGHPHGDVLDRLEDYGCTVYRTDQIGTIVFRR